MHTMTSISSYMKPINYYSILITLIWTVIVIASSVGFAFNVPHDQAHITYHLLVHNLLWALGLLGIIFARRLIQEMLRNEAETLHRLIESEKRFRTLAENSPDLIQRFNRAGVHLYANSAYLEAIQLPLEQIVGKSFAEIGVPTEQAQAFEAILEQMFIVTQPFDLDVDYPTRSGVILHYNTRLTPEFDEDGNIVSVLVISRNITERKQRQTQEFELVLERERRQVLSIFVHDAGHEFRTPLSTISASAYLMTRLEDVEQRQQKANQIEVQVRRITKLVDMLRLMATLENNTPLAHDEIHIAEIVREVCHEVAEEYGKVHQFRCSVLPELPPILGNEDYLADALKHIVENACRFTPAQGIISIRAAMEDDAIWLEVQDTGIGIEPEALGHIFDLFWRQDTAHTTPGFGLGLPITKKIVEQHGGRIEVKSEVEKGSCFRLVFPLNVLQCTVN